MFKRILTTLAPAAVAVLFLVPASAEAKWVVPGKGFGHGVGMSQYGAFGLAKEGRSHRRILRHYYTGVNIGQAKTKNVRVLITTGLGSLPFTNASRACGRNINPDRRFSFGTAGSRVVLRRAGGKRIKGCGREGTAAGGGNVQFVGVGAYRGRLIARNVGGSIYAINKVPLEGYVRGVIPNEVPASWPGAALRAQAVAARSYALATRVSGNGYDLYDDTRSQVYNGRSSEHPKTSRATKATRKQVIRADGGVATAYFFSTSGGKTENSEYVWSSPVSYLKSVRDPFDSASPVHRWRERFTNAEMRSKLGVNVGGIRRIRVVKTGESPRIVRARVVGSRGKATLSGDSLRTRLGLRSTWARFKKR